MSVSYIVTYVCKYNTLYTFFVAWELYPSSHDFARVIAFQFYLGETIVCLLVATMVVVVVIGVGLIIAVILYLGVPSY